GVAQQTNTICPLPGLARRDSAGNYYYSGLLDGTQNFGGITLVGGMFDQFNRGAWIPGHPSGYVAKYGANGQLQGAALFASLVPPYYFLTNAISDLLPDAVGGCYISYFSGPEFLTHFDGLNFNQGKIVFPPDPFTGAATFARLGGTSLS